MLSELILYKGKRFDFLYVTKLHYQRVTYGLYFTFQKIRDSNENYNNVAQGFKHLPIKVTIWRALQKLLMIHIIMCCMFIVLIISHKTVREATV